ncbi:MAG: hypothetical protein A3F67_08985 [Verrucomicrobia bacterium RIFCSPHIGHO2_12_FULL_41_10]|nr:MAG: hypothetical protein A3F67_08985 [Verrucomicrobia bacterium RIFCSPHIGHO2_12_FULL_41_10]
MKKIATKEHKETQKISISSIILLLDFGLFFSGSELFCESRSIFGSHHFLQTLKNNTPSRHSSGRWNPGERHYRIDDPIT